MEVRFNVASLTLRILTKFELDQLVWKIKNRSLLRTDRTTGLESIFGNIGRTLHASARK